MTENPATPAQPDAPEPAAVTPDEVDAPETVAEVTPVDDLIEIEPGMDEPIEIEPAFDEPVAIEQELDATAELAPADVEAEAVAEAEAGAEVEAEVEATVEATVEAEVSAAEVVAAADEVVAVPDEVVADELVVQDAAAEEPVAQEAVLDEPATSVAAEQPAPGPRPTPALIRPRPVPPAGAPAAPVTGQVPVVPAAPTLPAPAAPLDPAEVAAASAFGRVTEDGTVLVQDGDEEREVGQVPGASADDAMALYVRRFIDLQAKVVLFEARLAATDLSVKEIDSTIGKLTEELVAPAAVGDLVGLRARLDGLRAVAAERRAAAEAERAAARQAAQESRTAIVEQAEAIAATDPSRIQWRPAGEQLRALLDQWKDAQRNGPRLDRPTEEALWKRFSHARTTFDRERRHFFAELESRNASAKNVKEALVLQAEKLATSTDWAATAGAYRDLMAEWKAAGRASRPVDDALWARFRAAQDAFFASRDAAAAATDEEYAANLVVKERLAAEAETLLPVRDLAAAKAALRSIQDRWDAAGKVPRGDLQRIEGRLRAVEQAVRDADEHQWRRSNPETRARAEGMGAQLEQAIAGLEADLAKAEATGDRRKAAEVKAALDARRSWLEQVERAARDARG
ncbi:MAG: hypothetical protein BGO37_02510 [Cellulomonas sp. 73-92]|uniref:DUF349 domain-containing protein n=1 Tax=Cellulomonas sp. 73-92 TaxID=1895740 RepID=UPI000929133A|nr:DUF349 domain-containing protein [Cellulomonas sp. 73-92]OJV80268.1 MAG: hypothetical protein BGO37_02510 [Cellulomonas sp. 73-92]